MMENDNYGDGRRDAEIEAIKADLNELKPRVRKVEKFVYGALTLIGAAAYWPKVQGVMNALLP